MRDRLGGPVVVKSQVLVGGRGKAGGIKLATTPDEAETCAQEILGMDIKGLTVKKVLVDQAADIETEIYLGAVLDRAQRRVVLMASSEGGVEIEAGRRRDAGQDHHGCRPSLPRPTRLIRPESWPTASGCPRNMSRAFIKIAKGLYKAYRRERCHAGRDQSAGHHRRRRAAGRGRQDRLDDSALFRHPDLAEMRDPDEEDESELRGTSLAG